MESRLQLKLQRLALLHPSAGKVRLSRNLEQRGPERWSRQVDDARRSESAKEELIFVSSGGFSYVRCCISGISGCCLNMHVTKMWDHITLVLVDLHPSYLLNHLFHFMCRATSTTGTTLTTSPSPAYAGGNRALTNAPAANRNATRL